MHPSYALRPDGTRKPRARRCRCPMRCPRRHTPPGPTLGCGPSRPPATTGLHHIRRPPRLIHRPRRQPHPRRPLRIRAPTRRLPLTRLLPVVPSRPRSPTEPEGDRPALPWPAAMVAKRRAASSPATADQSVVSYTVYAGRQVGVMVVLGSARSSTRERELPAGGVPEDLPPGDMVWHQLFQLHEQRPVVDADRRP
jgi:hypothetical protein